MARGGVFVRDLRASEEWGAYSYTPEARLSIESLFQAAMVDLEANEAEVVDLKMRTCL